jgi:hypothetical protein
VKDALDLAAKPSRFWSHLRDRALAWLPEGAGPAGARLERAVALLAPEGCPVCEAAEESAARWIRYYVAQGNAEPEVHGALMASLGLCGRHLRRLAATRGGGDVYAQTAVYLAREAGRRAGSADAPAQCPACAREASAEEHALDTLVGMLGRPEVSERLAARKGLCFPHLLHAVRRRPGRPTLRLAELGLQALGEAGATLVARLRGRDDDAPGRGELLRAAALPARGPALREWAGAVLALDACPSCVAEREAVRGTLRWIASAELAPQGPPGKAAASPRSTHLEPFELRLCAGHLGALEALHPEAAIRVAAPLAAEWSGALGRYVSALHGAKVGQQSGQSPLESLLGNVACRACDVARGAGARTDALIVAALHDRGLAEAYGRAHGLCLRHLAALPSDERPPIALETLRARLALLGWELEEAQRKRSWFARWEAAGPEGGAWRRLPGLVGGADAGLPPAPR